MGESRIQIARRYVKAQLAIMEKFGSRPKLGRKRYWQLVRDVVKAFPAPPKPSGQTRPD